MVRTPSPPQPDLGQNGKRIYQLIRQQGSLSRADLVRQLDLTFPSVSRIVGDLLAVGMVVEGTKRRGGMGKPPIGVSIDPTHAYSLGVHHYQDRVHAVLINALGNLIDAQAFAASDLSTRLATILDRADLIDSQVLGVGVVASSDASAQKLAAQITSELHLPVTVASTLAASIRAERYFGAGRNPERFIYYDALPNELGAMVGNTVLAQPGVLGAFASIAGNDGVPSERQLHAALHAAAVLIDVDVFIVNGWPDKNRLRFEADSTGHRTEVASQHASDPALAAATLPLAGASSLR